MHDHIHGTAPEDRVTLRAEAFFPARATLES